MKPHDKIARIVLLLCGIVSAKCCTLTNDGHLHTEEELTEGLYFHKMDTMQPGEIIVEFDADGVTGIDYPDSEPYIGFQFKDKKLTVIVKDDFPDYENTQNVPSIQKSVNLHCEDAVTMALTVILTDTDNHPPLLSNETYNYKLPMPWPVGINIPSIFGEIWAYDADLTSTLDISISGEDSKLFKMSSKKIDGQNLPGQSYQKTYYTSEFNAVTSINEKSLSFTIIAMDPKNPTKTATATVNIERDENSSVTKSPYFAIPLYTVELSNGEEPGFELHPKEGNIQLENVDKTDKARVTMMGDEEFIQHFQMEFVSNEVKLTLSKTFEIPEPRFGLITLKAEVDKAELPGYSVIHIGFPKIVCPTTTTEPTTTTTMSTTTVAASTEDPCSSCPTVECTCPDITTTTTTEITCPTTIEPVTKSTEDPCISCPTIECTCPDINSTTIEVTTCPACDCSTTSEEPSDTTHVSTCPTQITCEPCTQPTTTDCPTCECSTYESSSTMISTTFTESTRTTTKPTTNTTISSTAKPDDTNTTTISSTSTKPTTPVTKSTEDPCSSCPTPECSCPDVCPTTTTEPTTPVTKSTEDSCSSCPTPECSCPDVCPTTTTEITCPTTIEPVTKSTEDPCSSCPTIECTCPDTSSTTTMKPTEVPPVPSNPTFPVSHYTATVHVGDMGFITHIEAYTIPPINPELIEYHIVDTDDDFVKRALKIIGGQLISSEPMQPGNYSFNATANIKSDPKIAEASVYLIANVLEICDNGTNLEVIFPQTFKSIDVNEEENIPKLTPPLNLPQFVHCNFNTKENIPIEKFKAELDGSIKMDKINREDEIFEGASVPEIQVTLTATCWKDQTSEWYLESYTDEISSPTSNSSMTVLVHVHDINDKKPEYKRETLLLGYPVKSIAELELPSQLGISEAYDLDVGENAIITYSVVDTDEVIIDEKSGYFHPHPQFFNYKDFNFSIVASDPSLQSTQYVEVKILSSKYLSEMRVEGAQLGDVPVVLDQLSRATGLQVGCVSARMAPTAKKRANQLEREEGQMLDETFSLRLITYAFKDGDPVDTNTFQRNVTDAHVGSILSVGGYRAPGAEEQADDMSAAVIALSVILALVVLGVVGFVYYWWRQRRKDRDDDSLETGLVDEKKDMKIQDNHLIYDSKKSSISSESTEKFEPQQEAGDSSPERRKSVAFAEEPQVIPSEDEDIDTNDTKI